ncbi:MAG: preprotein translocase subunit SecG [Bacteroidaceae bacterium]|nr:preprotein translocase subunit SecG [Bacteroidaceae bacterium]
MYNFLVILIVAASVLMCLVVLVQESKGGGLASSFADNNSMLGVRKTTDVIEKATWILAAVMVVCSVISVAFLGTPKSSAPAVVNPTENPANLPGIEAGSNAAPAAEAPVAPAPAPAQGE